jgi:poly(hydroxyalkanoate) depolymerase family esterase
MRAAAVGLGLFLAAPAAAAGEVSQETHGVRDVRVFAPTGVKENAAAIVMLHGCTQTPDGFADATRMDDVAEEGGFYAIYPEQPASIGSTRCWRWYDSAHQKHGSGEPADLAEIVSSVVAARKIDPARVYVAGISAGGAMSVILGATYPDRFAAIGVVAGLEYGAASSFGDLYTASQSGGPDPEVQGELAHAQMGDRARAMPVFVVHGTADGVVAKVNGDQVVAQWRKTNALILGEGAIGAPETSTGEEGYPFTRAVHSAGGKALIEHVVVEGLGHAWPGGRDGGSYADAKGPDASRLLAGFFGLKPLDATPPGDPTGPGGSGGGGGGEDGAGGGGGDGPAAAEPGDGGGCTLARLPAKGGLSDTAFAIGALALAAGLARRPRKGMRERHPRV